MKIYFYEKFKYYRFKITWQKACIFHVQCTCKGVLKHKNFNFQQHFVMWLVFPKPTSDLEICLSRLRYWENVRVLYLVLWPLCIGPALPLQQHHDDHGQWLPVPERPHLVQESGQADQICQPTGKVLWHTWYKYLDKYGRSNANQQVSYGNTYFQQMPSVFTRSNWFIFSVGIVFRLELISDSNIIMYRTINLVLDSVYTLEAENEYPCFIDLLSVK